MTPSTNMPIVLKLSPMDREWASRAIRSVVPPEDHRLQRDYIQLVVGGARGHSMPMLESAADKLVDLVYAARVHGGEKWRQAMEQLADKMQRERYRAAKSRSGNWVPVEKLAFPGIRHQRLCPLCGNPSEAIAVGKAKEWYCANCDSYELPEGEA